MRTSKMFDDHTFKLSDLIGKTIRIERHDAGDQFAVTGYDEKTRATYIIERGNKEKVEAYDNARAV